MAALRKELYDLLGVAGAAEDGHGHAPVARYLRKDVVYRRELLFVCQQHGLTAADRLVVWALLLQLLPEHRSEWQFVHTLLANKYEDVWNTAALLLLAWPADAQGRPRVLPFKPPPASSSPTELAVAGRSASPAPSAVATEPTIDQVCYMHLHDIMRMSHVRLDTLGHLVPAIQQVAQDPYLRYWLLVGLVQRHGDWVAALRGPVTADDIDCLLLKRSKVPATSQRAHLPPLGMTIEVPPAS